MRSNGIMHLAEGLAGDPHLLDLLHRFDHDGHGLAIRLRVECSAGETAAAILSARR